MQIYITLIRSVVLYRDKTSTVTEDDKGRLTRFKRQVIRKLYGGVQVDEDGDSGTTLK